MAPQKPIVNKSTESRADYSGNTERMEDTDYNSGIILGDLSTPIHKIMSEQNSSDVVNVSSFKSHTRHKEADLVPRSRIAQAQARHEQLLC